MPDAPGDAVYLEPVVADVPAPDERPYVEPAYLEVAGALDEDDAEPQPAAPKKRKVRAAERAQPELDSVWGTVLAALPTDRPLLLSLWPDVSASELLRDPPSAARFEERCAEAVRALDAIARRDAESRAKSEVAHRALQQRLTSLGASGDARGKALDELRDAQRRELSAALKVIAAGARELDADDLRRVAVAARDRGITDEEARALALSEGYELREERSTWSPLEALPGAPRGLEQAAATVLRQPLAAQRALRDGTLTRWIETNGGPPEVIASVAEARRAQERGAREALALHMLAWALGGRELLTPQGVSLTAPEEIVARLRERRIEPETLTALAESGALAAWLRLHGRPGPATAAELVAQGAPSGLRRFGWSLGQPFWLRERSFSDPSVLAREGASAMDLRAALVESYASGDLLAWLESLPRALRPESWISALRAAASRGYDDQLPLWSWVYRTAQSRSLNLQSGRGRLVTLTSLDQLKVTQQVADVWDGLKLALRTGELHGWLAVLGFESALDLPRPPVDEDVELNALLWEIGHQGLVVEWGQRDFAVSVPADLVRAYQTDWEQLETQVRRGYVLAWLDRFHGEMALVGKVKLRDVTGAFRAEIPRLPSGFVGLKLALLCGLRYLPVDPTQPGDAASQRGFVGVSPGAGAAAWEPLREHIAQGSAQLWLSRLPDVGPRRGPTLAQSAFLEVPLDALDSDATTSTPPSAPSKGKGRKRPAKPPPRPVDATIARLSNALGDPQPSPALVAERVSRSSLPSPPPPRASVVPPAPPPVVVAAPTPSWVPPPPPVPRAAALASPSPSWAPPSPAMQSQVPTPSAAPASPHGWPSQPPAYTSTYAPSVSVWNAQQSASYHQPLAHSGPAPEMFSRAWISGPGTSTGASIVRAAVVVVLIGFLAVCCCSFGIASSGEAPPASPISR